jgi:hypothetical protein
MANRYSVVGTPEYHPDAARWDDPAEHASLLAQIDRDFPDGWAYSLSAVSLRVLLPLAPQGCRIMAWVKPWVAFTGAWPAYGWEPVLARVSHGRTNLRRMKPKDWVAASVGAGHTEPFFGSKPVEFSRWLIDVFALGEHPGDELVDMFPGSGAVSRAWAEFRGGPVRDRGGATQGALFACADEKDEVG